MDSVRCEHKWIFINRSTIISRDQLDRLALRWMFLRIFFSILFLFDFATKTRECQSFCCLFVSVSMRWRTRQNVTTNAYGNVLIQVSQCSAFVRKRWKTYINCGFFLLFYQQLKWHFLGSRKSALKNLIFFFKANRLSLNFSHEIYSIFGVFHAMENLLPFFFIKHFNQNCYCALLVHYHCTSIQYFFLCSIF